MGKNILCILSSPRQNSNSGLLAEAVLEGAAEHGGHLIVAVIDDGHHLCRQGRVQRPVPAGGAAHRLLRALGVWPGDGYVDVIGGGRQGGRGQQHTQRQHQR